jgi:hypothetical protein
MEEKSIKKKIQNALRDRRRWGRGYHEDHFPSSGGLRKQAEEIIAENSLEQIRQESL